MNIDDVSDNEKLLRKFDRRDKALRVFEVAFLSLVVALTLTGLLRIQNVIDNNQQNAIAARKLNVQRQEEIKGYIKCILLIRYDNPNITQASPKADVVKALDKCAISTVKE